MTPEPATERLREAVPPRSETGSPSLTAMILAAGMGTRLRPLTLCRAKPAVPFLNQPLIHSALDMVYGLNPVGLVVNLHYLGESVIEAIREYAPAPGRSMLKPVFSRETVIQGTAGGVRAARETLLQGDLVVLVNGKIFSDFSLAPGVAHHLEQEAAVTLVVVPQRPGSPFNPVRVDPEGRVLGFGPHGDGVWHTFTGVQIWNRRVLERISAKDTDLVKDLYPDLIEAGERIVAWNPPGFWCEASTPRRYLDNSLEALRARRVPGDSFLDPVGGVIRHPGSRLGDGSMLHNTIVWHGCTIGKGCWLENVILCTGVHVADGTRLSEVILTPHLERGLPDPSTYAPHISHKDYLEWQIPHE